MSMSIIFRNNPTNYIVYMYICTCVYIYIHIYVYVYIYIYIYRPILTIQPSRAINTLWLNVATEQSPSLIGNSSMLIIYVYPPIPWLGYIIRGYLYLKTKSSGKRSKKNDEKNNQHVSMGKSTHDPSTGHRP